MKNKILSKLTVAMIACLFFVAGLVPVKAEPVQACTAQVAVTCAGGGTFEITSLSDEYPAPSETKLQINDKETKYFSITFDEPGTYEYQVKQIVPASKGSITYDEAVRDVAFYVTSEGDKLEPITVVNVNGKKVESLSFENKTPGKGKDTPSGKKTGSSILGNVQTDDPGLQWMTVFLTAFGMVLFVLFFRICSGSLIVDSDE